ncbi:BZ3500_MvSof-1268-A1-R1_Chr12-2g03953 [Microbotryum saponariae]|uniref:BZ3500_MvSof-1268-A1-R1_Chr12-2g03953 protein n=1 Tax=Microbotryum saponariae TaxID=289078 RepID=A0A2X0KSA9_9BASI|nr:BZ3500_MvSof-1268-A1-R1_Chr12-2g03953 [Microbotryum saponariae]
MTTTPPLATGANPPIPAEQLAALTSLLSGLTAAASGTATPATTSGTTRTAFPKHARLDGAKTYEGTIYHCTKRRGTSTSVSAYCPRSEMERSSTPPCARS